MMGGLIKFLLFLSISIAAIPVEASWFARGAGLLKNRLMQSTLALAGGYTAALLAHQAFASQQHANTQNTIRHIALPEYERCCQEIVKQQKIKVQQKREKKIEKLADNMHYYTKKNASWLIYLLCWPFGLLPDTDISRQEALKKSHEIYDDFDEVKKAVFSFYVPQISLRYSLLLGRGSGAGKKDWLKGKKFKPKPKYLIGIGPGASYGDTSWYRKGAFAHEMGHIKNGDCDPLLSKNFGSWEMSHENEYKADRVAVDAGYGNETKGLLEKILSEFGDELPGGPGKNHPRASDRIKAIEKRMAENEAVRQKNN